MFKLDSYCVCLIPNLCHDLILWLTLNVFQNARCLHHKSFTIRHIALHVTQMSNVNKLTHVR